MGKRQVQVSAQSVGFLLVPGFALMSYAAAIEPLRAANLISGKPLYRWWHAAPGGKPVMASNGLAIIPDVGAGSDRDVDMLFVCAGGNPATFNDRQVFAWLRKLARRGVTIGGISGGPYLLARAGLLDGRRVTLHWEHQPAFSEDFPDVAVSALAVRDRRQPHHLLGRHLGARHDGGADRARSWPPACRRGRRLVPAHPYPRGHGPAAHGSAAADSALPTRSCCACSAAWRATSRRRSPRAELARIAGVSVRQLERLFRRHLGHGIHRQYSSMRLERARQLLRETTLPVLDVAIATGFSSSSQFARAYKRTFGEPPSRTRLSG